MLQSFRVRAAAACVIAAAAAVIALVFTDPPLAVVVIAAVMLVIAAVLAVSAVLAVGASARMLGGAAREIAEGEFGTRLEEAGGDEIGQVYEEFNRMATRLEQRVAETSQERNRLMAAINSSIDAVIAVDAESNITFANAAVESLLGASPDEIVDQPFVWVMPDADVIDALRDSREHGASSSHIVERPNRRFLSAIVTPIVGAGRWASLVVFHDLTDVKRLETMRRDFVANVSHELRTPLAAIKSVIETLAGGALDDRRLSEDFLARADGEVDRLVLLVEELLELSRIESGELEVSREPLDIGALARSAAERLRTNADRSGLTLTTDIEPDLAQVAGDYGSIERAVVNLVHNAIKFTPQGGSIRVAAYRDSSGVTIEVSDTGVGIEPQDIPRVFERFFKADRARNAEGTGLGLAVVKHTAEANGGHVSVESKYGSGSSFRIWLPADANA